MTESDRGEWVPMRDLAEILAVSPRTLQRRVRSGEVEVTSIGGTRYGRPIIRREAHDTGDTPNRTGPDDATAHVDAQSATRRSTRPGADDALALVVRTLQSERAELVREVVDAERRLADTRAELARQSERAEHLAAAADREHHERLALAAQLEAARRHADAERARAAQLEQAARLPWYAGRRRREALAMHAAD